MVIIEAGFNSTDNSITIAVTTPILNRYSEAFRKVFEISKNPNLPKKLEVEYSNSSETMLVNFPAEQEELAQVKNGKSIPIPATKIEAIRKEINRFVVYVLKKELKSIEFIPLNGYPVEELKKDVQAAVKGKRKFCLIKTYEEYLKNQKANSKNAFTYHQYMVEYGTPEYIEVALNLYNGEIDILREKYEPQLKYTNWI